MPDEIEAKFKIDDHAPLRTRLDEVGATAAGGVLEINRIFDTPDRRLLGADRGLRVRTCRPLDSAADQSDAMALLTYKGPRAAGQFKRREELEATVADYAALVTILERLGFREVVVYHKRRETFHLGVCEITLDELPRLGWWLEIEAPDDTSLRRAARQLGLDERLAVAETYVEMAATHGTPDAAGCRRLVFDGVL